MSRADTEARWHAIWAQRGWAARLLWPVSIVYGSLIAVRRWLYDRDVLRAQRLPVPVIVVGNVVVGGAGKTPTVLALLQHLKNQGWTPGVVSRGHGRQGDGVLELDLDTPAEVGGDEPVLIRRSADVPVFVARQRAEAGRALLARHPEVDLVVCDDGLQHLPLERDLTVTVFDDRGVGNGWLLPAGLLREPWPTCASKRKTPVLVLRHRREGAEDGAPLAMPDGVKAFRAQRRLADHAVGPTGQRRSLDDWGSTPLIAVAGIARPGVFFDMLRQRGLNLEHTITLADHAAAADYHAALENLSGTLLCTEKDAVKLFAVLAAELGRRLECWAVPLELRPEAAFFTALDQHLASLSGARLSSPHGHQTA